MFKKILLIISIILIASSVFLHLEFNQNQGLSLEKNVTVAADTKCADGNPPQEYDLGDKTIKDCYENLTSAQKDKLGGTTCKNQGLSWLICPIINLLVGGIRQVEKLIVDLLYNAPLTVGTAGNADNVIYSLWNNIKNISNGLLALVFLIMILGNSISIGIDAYTIKRTLPRLVIAAILMQFSFALCGLFIEFTNIIGVGILELGNRVTTGVTFGSVGADGQLVAGLGLAAGSVAIVVLAASGAGLIMILAGLIAAVGTLITLGLRQLLILMLVVASPLALLAWILPNTENLFKSWLKNFTRTLLMFPLISALLVVAGIGTKLALSQGGMTNDILAFVLIIAPMFAVPFTFKWAGGIMSAGAGAISGFAAGKASQLKGSQFAKNLKESRREANLANAVRPSPTRFGKAGRAFGATRRGIGKLGAYGGGAVYGGGVTKAGRMRYQQKVAREGAAAQAAVSGRYQEALRARANRLEAYDFSGAPNARENNVKIFGESMVKEIEATGATNANDLYGMELQKVAGGGSSTIIGANGKDIQMQTSAISEMAKRGDIEELRSLQTPSGERKAVSQSTMMAGIGDSVGDIMSKAPDIIKNGAPGEAIWGKMTADKIAALDDSSVKLMETFFGSAIGDNSGTATREAANQILAEVQKMAQNKDLQTNLSPEMKKSLNNIGGGYGATFT